MLFSHREVNINGDFLTCVSNNFFVTTGMRHVLSMSKGVATAFRGGGLA